MGLPPLVPETSVSTDFTIQAEIIAILQIFECYVNTSFMLPQQENASSSIKEWQQMRNKRKSPGRT